MVQANIKEIGETIKGWDDNTLVINARFKLDHYIPTVRDLIIAELKTRNLPVEAVKKIESDENNRLIRNDHKTHYGIKGHLLYFVLQLLALASGIFIYCADYRLRNSMDIVQTLLYSVAGIFCLYTAITIIQKKKKSISLSKILLYSLAIIFLVIYVINIFAGDALGEFIAFILNAGNCLIWVNYFNSSKRVLITLTR